MHFPHINTYIVWMSPFLKESLLRVLICFLYYFFLCFIHTMTIHTHIIRCVFAPQPDLYSYAIALLHMISTHLTHAALTHCLLCVYSNSSIILFFIFFFVFISKQSLAPFSFHLYIFISWNSLEFTSISESYYFNKVKKKKKES